VEDVTPMGAPKPRLRSAEQFKLILDTLLHDLVVSLMGVTACCAVCTELRVMAIATRCPGPLSLSDSRPGD
jgi:hypothetical protein